MQEDDPAAALPAVYAPGRDEAEFPQPPQRAKPWLGLAVVAAMVVLVTGVAQTGIGQELLRRTGLIAAPLNYTSLSFAHPLSLPQQFTSTRARTAVGFVIQNHAATVHTYRWSILVVQDGKTARAGVGGLTLGPDKRAQVTRTVATVCARGSLRIVVRLASPAESIDALVTCP